VTKKRSKTFVLLATLAAVLLFAGCNKRLAAVKPPPPPPPQPVAPTAALAANPDVIQPGQSTTLAWQTSHASEITIAGLAPCHPPVPAG
jgi:hypothetical protein